MMRHKKLMRSRDCYYYEPSNNSWIQTTSIDRAREDASSVLMPSGEWLIAAGAVGGTHEGGSHIYEQGPGPKLPLYLNGQCMARVDDRWVEME